MIIEVQTTQNVSIDYETAGIGYRLLAYILDWIIIIIWIIGWINLLDITFGFGLNLNAMFIIFIFIPVIFYDLIFEIVNNGQTPGKMLVKIRVISLDGTTPSLSSYLLRWLFRIVDFTVTEGFLAVIMIALTKNSQRLGDYLAGTTVIDLRLNSQNKELRLSDLDFKKNYEVVYSDILDKLSDKDIQTIYSIIGDERMKESEYFIKRLADKIKIVTDYSYDGSDKAFLNKIINDYNYMAVQDT